MDHQWILRTPQAVIALGSTRVFVPNLPAVEVCGVAASINHAVFDMLQLDQEAITQRLANYAAYEQGLL
ncbi:hypothetical protein Plhal304r1_c069g0158101 [Plasmopara halstedii]